MLVLNNHEHARKIAKAAGTFFNPDCDHCISRVEHGELLGGVIFTGYKVASIGLHAAGFAPRWLDRDMLWMTFHYPFEQLGVQKIVATIPTSNQKAVLFDRKLGFVEEARIKDLFPDGDLLIMTMTRDQCRWLERGRRGR